MLEASIIFLDIPFTITDLKCSKTGNWVKITRLNKGHGLFEKYPELFKEYYQEHPYQKIFFSHADCYKDVDLLKEIIMHNLDNKDIPVHIGSIGPIVGASVGPGTIAVYFFGKEVTHIGK